LKTKRILLKARENPEGIRFNDLVKLVEHLGFEEGGGQGSHHVFSHPDLQEIINLQKGKHGKAKPYQVRQALKLIKQYNLRISDE